MNNLEKYKKDLKSLISEGEELFLMMGYKCFPERFENAHKKTKDLLKNATSFNDGYQSWYSEALAVIKLMLPDRLNDFIKLYERPKNRKTVVWENYVIEDFLQDLTIEIGEFLKKIVVDLPAAIPKFEQQLNILKSAQRRFDSSLFDIEQLIQADLFDSEIDVATELNRKGFMRGAGAVAGVVLEGHLAQVCKNHDLKITKKNPTINDFNELLKKQKVIPTKDFRHIQHLADLRNLCDHKKEQDPTKTDIDDLIQGINKVIKNIY